jgi:Mor family transcriptional regulator
VTLKAVGKAIGATAETIVADASRKIAALNAFSDSISKQTADQVVREELEIAALLAQIEDKRKSIESAKKKQAQISQVCDTASERLDEVLEFFSLDVSPSKYAQTEEKKSG